VSGYEDNHGSATLLPYSGQPGFSFPLVFGVLSIVLSFGKGLVFFAPGLLLPLPAGSLGPEARAARRMWLAFLLGLVLVYARWWAWYGGNFWGPRFFLFASVPAALALAVRLSAARRLTLAANCATLACLALSCWVGAEGLAWDQLNMGECFANDYALEYLAWYVPEYSALWRPFAAPPAFSVTRTMAVCVFAAGFLYLATPLVGMCARQLAARIRRVWDASRRMNGAWRF
jgi:hypothetical protein